MAILWNPANPGQTLNFNEVEATAAAFKLMLRSLPVKSPDDFDNAFAVAAKGRVEGLLVLGDALLNSHRSRIVELVVKGRLPAMYTEPESISDGGLMYYGPDTADNYRRAATYVDKILKGAKAADLPVERPIRFDFIISLKAAKQIGLTIPPNVLARADRVIR